MTPLHVVAELAGPIAMPGGPLALDALLAWAVCQRDGIPLALTAEELRPIEIPVAREPGGRFHLASFAEYEVESRDRRWKNRRFPLPEAQLMGEQRLKRILITGGPCKSYRIPMVAEHLVDDWIEWWCVGDEREVRELLALVGYLGQRRAVGLGRVRRWYVGACPPWGDGFPVVRDGKPLRTLPADWPGLVEPRMALKVLSYPYWRHTDEELCAVPWS